MGSEWRECTLGDTGKIVTGKTPPTSEPGFFGGDWLFVTPSDMEDRKIISKTIRTLSDTGANKVKGSILPINAVMVSCIGSDMGKVAISGKSSITNQQINSIICKSNIDPHFLYYSLKMKRDELQSLSRGGSAVPILNKGHFSSINIYIPSFIDQQKIASILSAIDDKIALNRQTNATLEAIAQALFKSWFVDFDPVRAKIEGRDPEGMDEATAALFPSELMESELGLIPKGWRVCPIGDVVETVGGGTPSTKEPAYWDDGQYCWVTPKDLSSLQFPVLLDTERKITQAGVDKISSGLLPVGTLLLSSRAPVGYLAITRVPTAINQGFIAMSPSKVVSAVFLLYWTKVNMDRIEQRANGSTFMEISKKNFRPILALIPSKPCLDAFSVKTQ